MKDDIVTVDNKTVLPLAHKVVASELWLPGMSNAASPKNPKKQKMAKIIGNALCI